MRRALWLTLDVLMLIAALLVVRRAYQVVNYRLPAIMEAPAAGGAPAGPFELPRLAREVPAERYRIIVEKNLFSPSRAPAPPPPPPGEAVRAPMANPADRHVVYGIVSVDPETFRAIIRDKKNPAAKPRQYGTGDTIADGYTIRRIDGRGVLVAASDGVETLLDLRAPKGPEDTGPASRAAATGQPSTMPGATGGRLSTASPGGSAVTPGRIPTSPRTIPPRPSSPRSMVVPEGDPAGSVPPVNMDTILEMQGDPGIPAELTPPTDAETEYWNTP